MSRLLSPASAMRFSVDSHAKTRGFSLIELMIAMVLGLLLVEGIFVLFSVTGRVNATQAALSRLQENGRIALNVISEDLRLSGYLPCGSRVQPQVFSDGLANHISGAPATANAPTGWPLNTSYPLDRGIFIGGNTCTAKTCAPPVVASQGLPRAGLAAGDKIPGTDVLTVRYLQGNGWAANGNGSRQTCDEKNTISSIAIRKMPGDPPLDGFKSAHLALLAGCSSGEVFQVSMQGDALQPALGKFGAPACMAADSQARLFDLDTQLQTSIYYLQMVQDESKPGHAISTLMRRINGVTDELVQGVERLDLRYSLLDASGSAHWLSAGEVDRGVSNDGTSLLCKASGATSTQACTWSDVNAVEVTMLLNTVDDLPVDAATDAWNYRYSMDDDRVHAPAATMPVTGLPAGRMLRREFRSVVALRSLST